MIQFGHAWLPPRFWAKVSEDPITGCWNWTAALSGRGYGQYSIRARRVYAHRAAYAALVGPIPKGMEIDHVKCRNKRCCNPAHLDVVTSAENTRRWAETVTACPAGHAYTEANTWHGKQRAGRYRMKQCRTCQRERQRAARARKAAA